MGSQDLLVPSQTDDIFLITIGSYNGPQLSSFEEWLNSQLSLNSSVFPIFRGEIIELSEEFNNFPHYPVKLGASTLRGSLDFESYSSGNKLDSSIGEITLDSLKIDDYNVERLLMTLKRICLGIGGEGIIGKQQGFKGAGLSKVIPSEQGNFKECSLQIFKEMENLFKQVGTLNTLRILDLIANPFTTALDQELCGIVSHSREVDFIPVTDIHIPVIRGTNAGSGSIALSSCSVDQNVYGYHNHKSTRTPIICYPSEMSVESWNALVGCNASNGTTKTVKGVIIALNLQSSPFKKIGLSPENGFYFTVPIGWIGEKQIKVQSFKDIVKQGSRILQPIERSFDNTTPNKKQYSQRNSNVSSPSSVSPASASPPSAKSDDGENDRKSKGSTNNWTCPNCKLQIFARRSVCFKCHTCRPEQYHPFPRKPPITFNRPEGDVRDGDWICHHCNGHNFASKLACFTCHKIRPGCEEALSVNNSNGETKDSRVLPGDWVCSKCKENVFAKRNRCYKCSNPRS